MATKFLTGIDANSQRVRAVASPSAATDAANKQYVDNLIYGLRWKDPVVAATTSAGTLDSDFEDGDTLDGVVLATGDRILIKNQTDAAENGIYVVVASGAPSRASDADSTSEVQGLAVLVTGGSTNADKMFVQTADDVEIGTDDLTFSEFGGGTTYSADGQGIELSGTTFALELAANSALSKSASGLTVANTIAGNGTTFSNGVIDIGAGDGIIVNADGIEIDTSVVVTTPATVVRKYAANIGNNSSTSIAVTHGLGTRDVTVGIYEADSPYTEVYADVVHTDANTVTIDFATAPSTDQYRVVVHG